MRKHENAAASDTKASPIQSKKDNFRHDACAKSPRLRLGSASQTFAFAKLFIAKTGAPKRLRFGEKPERRSEREAALNAQA